MNMNVETLVKDVQGAVEPIVAKGQKVVLASFETLKSVNVIVVDGVQTLVQTQFDATKDLFNAVQISFEKARTDGLKAVAADPIAYLPEGKDRVVSAYNDTLATLSKTGEELVKTLKDGYDTISAKLNGAKVHTTTRVRKTVRKAGARARKTARAA
jgi:hypothetical protein